MGSFAERPNPAMTARQTTFDLADDAAGQALVAMPGSAAPWKESWHNHEIPFGKLTREQQTAAMNETAKWLFKGRRWPLGPSRRQHEHCLYWFPAVERIMAKHGWQFSWEQSEQFGFVVTWTLLRAPEHIVNGCGSSAPYAAITSAAICRRKARYYGLWQNND